MYSKGSRYYENEPVYGSSIDDIDMGFVQEYCEKIGYRKSPEEYIKQNKKFIVNVNGRKEMSGAAILLFGKNPQLFFERSRVRFIRYEGSEAEVGSEMNVVKDVIFEGRILELVEKTIRFVSSQIKERTYLGKGARFVTEAEYPEFVWKELIVNAIAHRDYSIKGTDIQIKMFDDHITVESPGTLPGIVCLDNMREIHFSRNPKIAEFLHDYEYVREFGEGIDRMFYEMNKAGLLDPVYKNEAFMVYATIWNRVISEQDVIGGTPQDTPQDIYKNILDYCELPRSKNEIMTYLGLKDRKSFRMIYLKPLLNEGKLLMTLPDKPNSKKQKYVTKK